MINLMFCGNEKVLDGMIISLLSIVKYNKEELNVYLLTMDLQDINKEYKQINLKQIERLSNILKKVNKNSKIQLIYVTYLFRKELEKSKNIKTHYTPYIFVRLFSSQIKELPDKILYLDCDIVCNNDIKKLYDIDISDYEIAGVLDYFGRIFIKKDYMNSGVLLINMKKVRQTELFENCIKLCQTKRMLLPDQTALNKYAKNKLYLPRKYNEQKKLQEDTIIRHFSMTIRFMPYFHLLNIKPWQIDRVHKKYKIYKFDDIFEQYKIIKLQYEKEN